MYSHEAEFVQKLPYEKTKYVVVDFVSKFGYIDDALSPTIINSIHLSIPYIPMNWKSETPQNVPCLLYIRCIIEIGHSQQNNVPIL
jgi:hypothetical protein